MLDGREKVGGGGKSIVSLLPRSILLGATRAQGGGAVLATTVHWQSVTLAHSLDGRDGRMIRHQRRRRRHRLRVPGEREKSLERKISRRDTRVSVNM